MSFAILGSGAIGRALATQFARKRIDVMVANRRGPKSLADFAKDLGQNITAVSVQDALRADVVVLAIPFDSVPEAVRGSQWAGRIAVDATNAIQFPSFTPKDLGGRMSTDVVAEAIPGARVVKAFNTLPAAVLAADPAQHGGRRVIFLSGNEKGANAEIAAVIERLGFAAIDLGKIGEGGRLQQFGGPLAALDLTRHGP
ncbi:MAG TPA: NADPH-dependent F420 reductase [Myxococcales bacterium]|nr:NADPH-dependent F420 reductase [Myxococcales bacterium]